MATKPEHLEATKRWRIAYEARCSHSTSEMVKTLKRMSEEFWGGADGMDKR